MKAWKQLILPDREELSYCGRIDFDNRRAPVFLYACSNVRFCTDAREGYLIAENHHSYFENTVGVLVDGEYRGRITLHDGEKRLGEEKKWFLGRLTCEEARCLEGIADREDIRYYELTPFLDGREHEITLFKRMDGCHYYTFHGIVLDGEAQVKSPAPAPDRRIEVYGDSVSCGEVSEAVAFCGQGDPEGHNGIYSNSFYSYSWILARMLGARLHDVAQGGIALRDGEGYFNMPESLGMSSVYDKLRYQPALGALKPWDFTRYTPHVVIVAIGQNDAHPDNYMAKEYEGEKAGAWRAAYAEFIKALRSRYPKAQIILTTTILNHDPAWDRAIAEAGASLKDPKVHHFLYQKNGCGTGGHIRRPEAEQMARELKEYIDSLGEDIWED